MSKYSERCEHCGSIKNFYQHKINKPMVSALLQLYRIGRPVNLQKDLKLTKNQYNNFQKLQYLFLVEPVMGSSSWFITKSGKEFIENTLTICNSGFTFGGEILHHDDELVKRLRCHYEFVTVEEVVKEDYQKLVDYIK